MKKRPDGRYVETVTDPITKKRKYFYGKTIAEVRRRIAAYDATEVSECTYKDMAEQWEEEHFKEIEYGTQVCYTPALKRSIAYFENTKIKDITPVDVKNYVTMIAKKGLAQQTVKIHYIVVKLVLDHAIYVEEIKFNPAEIIKLPKGLPKKEREMPSNNHIQTVKEYAHTNQMGRFAYLLLYSGLRKSEALALCWKDIDFINKIIIVNKVSEFKDNKAYIKNYTKTKSSTRNVILLDKLAEIILPYKGDDDDLVFPGNNGLMTRSEFFKRWKRYCIDTGMVIDGSNDLTPHQLRHAFVTMLYEAGVDAESAMLMTGHSNIATMRDVYTHIREKKTKEMADKLNAFEW